MHPDESFGGCVEVDARNRSTVERVDQGDVASAEFLVGVSDQEQVAAGLLEVHRNDSGDVLDLSQGTDQQRRGDGDVLPLSGFVIPGELVVQAVLATDERCAEGDGGVVATQGCPDQCPQRLGAFGVSPAEVVEDRDPCGVGTGRDAVPQGLVDRGDCHPVGIEVAVVGVDSAGDDQATVRFKVGADNRGV